MRPTQSRCVRLDRHDLGGGVQAAFTARRGGVSAPPYDELNLGGAVGDRPEAVTENRRRAADALGVSPDAVTWMRQVHGADVGLVSVAGRPDIAESDGMVTDRSGLVLAVLVADCTPILLADPVHRVVAAAHAGRPGLARGVVAATLVRMRDLGAAPELCVAVIGPAVCAGCYEVPERMRSEVVAAAGPAAWAETRQGTPALDVPGGVAAQLRAAGVAEVRRVPVCSKESDAHYSYRRDGVTGRFAGYVRLDDRGLRGRPGGGVGT